MDNAPYRDNADSIRQRAENAERRISAMMSKQAKAKRVNRLVGLLIGCVAVALYLVLIGIGFALERSHAEPWSNFNPWHPWVACCIGALAVSVYLIVLLESGSKDESNG